MVYQCNARDRRCKMKANRTWAAKNNFLGLAKIHYHFITFDPNSDAISTSQYCGTSRLMSSAYLLSTLVGDNGLKLYSIPDSAEKVVTIL